MAVRRPVRFRAEDIWDTPDDGNRYEVIDGDLYMTPPPVEIHQRGAGNLYGFIWQYLRAHPIGVVYMAPIGVKLDGSNGLQPDIVYVSNERRDIIKEREIEGAPDLVVEVLSPSTEARDRGVKFRRYAAAGVRQYWLLAPLSQSLEVYVLGDAGYEPTATYGPGMTFSPTPFPGLDIPIDEIWQ